MIPVANTLLYKIRYDTLCLTCSKKLTDYSQLNLFSLIIIIITDLYSAFRSEDTWAFEATTRNEQKCIKKIKKIN